MKFLKRGKWCIHSRCKVENLHKDASSPANKILGVAGRLSKRLSNIIFTYMFVCMAWKVALSEAKQFALINQLSVEGWPVPSRSAGKNGSIWHQYIYQMYHKYEHELDALFYCRLLSNSSHSFTDCHISFLSGYVQTMICDSTLTVTTTKAV